MPALRVPCRINLLGGWSDQSCWPHPGAVVNAAVGWNDPAWEHSPYPLHHDGMTWTSNVEGVGTGLGISSIRHAAEVWHKVKDFSRPNCILYAVHKERESGVHGGWQDAAGVLYPGGKLVASQDHRSFDVTDMSAHPVWQHAVLFDTGIRREGKLIGDSVRRLIEGEPKFREFLAGTVEQAMDAPHGPPGLLICQAIKAWDALCEWVPAMHVDVPFIQDTRGYMLAGAGGGGFGLYFTHRPDDRARVIARLKAEGLAAWEPILLPGIQD